MLIWLGKTYLGQKDQPDSNLSQHTNIVVDAALPLTSSNPISPLSATSAARKLFPSLINSPLTLISSLHSRMFPPRMRVEQYPNPERR